MHTYLHKLFYYKDNALKCVICMCTCIYVYMQEYIVICICAYMCMRIDNAYLEHITPSNICVRYISLMDVYAYVFECVCAYMYVYVCKDIQFSFSRAFLICIIIDVQLTLVTST